MSNVGKGGILTEERASVRAVRGSAYSIGASIITLILGFVRSVVLAWFLLPEHFGVVTMALFYANLVNIFLSLGLSRAIVHHKAPDQTVLRTYFSLTLLSIVTEVVVVLGLAPILGRFHPDMPALVPVLLVLAGVHVVKGLNTYQEALLSKALSFRLLAITDVLSSLSMTVTASLAAWQGFGLWSLVIEQFAGHVARGFVLWTSRDAVRPRLGWSGDVAHWFWDFGLKVWWGTKLAFVLDRFDDFWAGTSLGKTPLGFYSRAYEFAHYPRRAVANPLLAVFFPTFATLQDDRLNLSRAFFRVTSLMVRIGFWFSLGFILAAPEFVRVILGERWLPMVTPFQLMIVYTLADPLVVVTSNLLMATGHPEIINRTRAIQIVVFVPAVIVLASVAGIVGVAIAADLMILVGVILLFVQTRRFVDYSISALWLYPVVALAVTVAVILGLNPLWRSLSPWASLVGKGGLITIVYGLPLWFAEREQWRAGKRIIQQVWRAGMKG